jgi:hypothetical protein
VTLEEFERGYADRSGLTVENLHAYGRRGRPCRCEQEGCEGWQMISDELWADPFIRMQAGVITPEEMDAEYGD